MSKVFYLYLLVDPRSPTEVRYVGQTVEPSVRFKRHLWEAKSHRTETYRCKWIRSLLSEGLEPLMLIFATFNTQERTNSGEIYWIAAFKECGFRLTNHTLGGGGKAGYKTSDETRKLQSDIGKTRAASMTTGQRKLVSKQMLEGKAKLSFDQLSDAAKRAIAAQTPEELSARLHKGYASQSKEQKIARTIKANAAQTSEQRSINSKRYHTNASKEQKQERSKKIWETRRLNQLKQLAEVVATERLPEIPPE